jgi:hypothetical protein
MTGGVVKEAVSSGASGLSAAMLCSRVKRGCMAEVWLGRLAAGWLVEQVTDLRQKRDLQDVTGHRQVGRQGGQ